MMSQLCRGGKIRNFWQDRPVPAAKYRVQSRIRRLAGYPQTISDWYARRLEENGPATRMRKDKPHLGFMKFGHMPRNYLGWRYWGQVFKGKERWSGGVRPRSTGPNYYRRRVRSPRVIVAK